MSVGGQRHAPAALPPGKRPDTRCIGGWMGPRAGLDGCGKSRLHRDSGPCMCAHVSAFPGHPDGTIQPRQINLCHICATLELKYKYDTQCTEISYICNHFGILTPPLHTSPRIAENSGICSGFTAGLCITVSGYSVGWPETCISLRRGNVCIW